MWLEAGEEREVMLSVEGKDLGHYDETNERWVCEGGKYKITLGISSGEAIQTLSFNLIKADKCLVYHKLLPLEWFQKNPETEKILKGKSENAKTMFGPQKGTIENFMYALPADGGLYVRRRHISRRAGGNNRLIE